MYKCALPSLQSVVMSSLSKLLSNPNGAPEDENKRPRRQPMSQQYSGGATRERRLRMPQVAGLVLASLLMVACSKVEHNLPWCNVSTGLGVRITYGLLTGRMADKSCTITTKFPGYAAAGEIAPDAGCIHIWIWKCRRSTDADQTKILQSVGWKTTDDAGRIRIALDWLAIKGDHFSTN